MKVLEAFLENLKTVLINKERYYRIPNYQRPYSWEDENVTDLFMDITSAYSNTKNTEGDKSYFCGSIVLIEPPNGEAYFDVIDGQQRLTTIIILLCVIRDFFMFVIDPEYQEYIERAIKNKHKETSRISFFTSKENQAFFEENIINGVKLPSKSSAKNNYTDNAAHIKLWLENHLKNDDDEEIEIQEWIKYLFNNVKLTVVICPDENSAIKIFNVLNTRGMILSPLDILKAHLMHDLDNNERESLNYKWAEINTYLGAHDLELEGVINPAYVYYKLAANPSKRYDEVLLDAFKKENQSPLSVVDEMSKFSEGYSAVINIESRHISCLKYLPHQIYWKSILSIAHYRNYKDIDELTKYINAYFYQNWISGGTSARIKQPSFRIMKYVKENQPIDTIYQDIKEEVSNTWGLTKKYKAELENINVDNRKWIKPVLSLINYFSVDNSSPSFRSITDKKNPIEIEHIYPITDTNEYWKERFNEEDRQKNLHCIGNLTLLAKRKNAQASNDPFPEKKRTYSERDNQITDFAITQELTKYDEWNPKNVEERKNNIIESINRVIDIFQ